MALELVTSSKSVTMTLSILTTDMPSASPTLTPEVIPGLSQPLLIAAVVLTIIVSCCCVGGLYVALSRHQDKKYKKQLEKATFKVPKYEKLRYQDNTSILGGVHLNSIDIYNDSHISAVSVNHSSNAWFEEVKDDKMVIANSKWDHTNWL